MQNDDNKEFIDEDEPQEFSLYSSVSPTITDIKELQQLLAEKKQIHSIRIMHSINLKSIQVNY